jgi:hypothetical protein
MAAQNNLDSMYNAHVNKVLHIHLFKYHLALYKIFLFANISTLKDLSILHGLKILILVKLG